MHLDELGYWAIRAPWPYSSTRPKVNIHKPERVGLLHQSAQLTLTGSSKLLNKLNESRSGQSQQQASLPPRLADTWKVLPGCGFVQGGHTAEAALSHVCQQSKILILNFSMKPIAILSGSGWLERLARAMGMQCQSRLSMNWDRFHASPPAGWHFGNCNSP